MSDFVSHLKPLICGSICALGALAQAAVAAGPYTITPIDTLGGDRNFANDVSDTGIVTGNSRKAGSTQLIPYVWQAGVVEEIPVLPGVPTFGRGFAVNDAGIVVGESGNGPSKAFYYDSTANTISDLGGLPGGPGTGVANDINNAGRVVGTSSNGQSSRPFYIDGPGGTMVDLGTPAGVANTLGRANAISQNGIIAGSARNIANTNTEPTIWLPQPNGSYIPTTIGSPAGSVFGAAEGVNDDGFAVGYYSDPVSGDTRAFLYDGVTNVDLPIFDTRPTLDNARALDINAAGQVVGMISDFDNAPSFGDGGVAVLWENGTPIDLNGLIPAGSNWTLLSANGINSQGQIVGYGTFGGDTRAFLLTPIPEPAGLTMLGLAGLGLRRRRGK